MTACPGCQANLEGTSAFKRTPAVCPFCGMRLERPEDADDWPADHDDESVEDHGQPQRIPQGATLPPKSRIHVVEASADRLVLHLPSGGEQAAGVGCFALCWNGFMCLFTPPWLFALQDDAPGPFLFVFVFLAVFWAVGLGMAYYWVRLKWIKTNLLIEPDRAVLQTDLFGRKSLKATELSPGVGAALETAYELNDKPVYAVTLKGTDQTLKFATQLSQKEKDWLLQTINDFLGTDYAAEVPRFCSACGTRFTLKEITGDAPLTCASCGANHTRYTATSAQAGPLVDVSLDVPKIRPEDVSPDSLIEMEETIGEQLQFSLPALPDGAARRWITIIGGGISTLWFGIALYNLSNTVAQWQGGDLLDAIPILLAVLMLLPSILLLSICWVARSGRARITVDSQWLRVRWGKGPLRFRKKMKVADIERIRLTKTLGDPKKVRSPSRTGSSFDYPVVVAMAEGDDEKTLLLTIFHPLEVARTVAGLVQTHLESLGVLKN